MALDDSTIQWQPSFDDGLQWWLLMLVPFRKWQHSKKTNMNASKCNFLFALDFLHFIAVVVLNSWTCNSLHNYMILLCCWQCLHMFICNTLCCMVDQLMLHTSFKGRRERDRKGECMILNWRRMVEKKWRQERIRM